MAEIEGLRNVKKAELLAHGVRLVGTFTLPERIAVVNGQVVGVDSQGNFFGLAGVQGHPIGSCGFCGYLPLHNHYTLKDKSTGELLNVGSECLADIYGSAKGDYLKKGIESIKRKITADFKRPFQHADLEVFLQANKERLTASRNARIDNKLAIAPHYYLDIWTESVQLIPESFRKNKAWSTANYAESLGMTYDQWKESVFDAVWQTVPHEKYNDQQAIKLQNARKSEVADRNFWIDQAGKFGGKDWNPQNMKKEYEKEAKKDGIELKITFTPLTEAQTVELHKQIDAAINAWIDKLAGDKKK